ncbi:unnamed protein product [Linum tenue]|uniref:Uncharacterized protein n=1 Tax=Linum tenue TaxID=586396 RepID=A0AAV0RZY8_9ROSI|nr:unnamed protein product [Linum tenue]
MSATTPRSKWRKGSQGLVRAVEVSNYRTKQLITFTIPQSRRIPIMLSSEVNDESGNPIWKKQVRAGRISSAARSPREIEF